MMRLRFIRAFLLTVIACVFCLSAVPCALAVDETCLDTGEAPAQRPMQDYRFRLLVGADGQLTLQPEDAVLGIMGSTYLLGYEDADSLVAAQERLTPQARFATIDGVLGAAEGSDTETPVDTVASASESAAFDAFDNPFSLAAETDPASRDEPCIIALVDTGSPEGGNIVARYSVVSDDPADANGHGSKMAETITELNPEAQIVSIQALDAEGRGTVSSVYAGIMVAVDSGASIINLSFSAAGSSPAIEEAIAYAVANECAVVVAAGNAGDDASGYCPANCEGAIAIGALDDSGQPLASSNYGDSVDAWVCAPSTSFAAAKASAWLSLSGKPPWLDSLLSAGSPAQSLDTQESGSQAGNSDPTSTGEIPGLDDLQFLISASAWSNLANGTYVILYGPNNKYALDRAGGNSANGTNVQLYTSNGSRDGQQWVINSFSGDSDNCYKVLSAASTGYSLDIKDGTLSNGTNLQMYAWNGSKTQEWYLDKNSNGTGTFTSYKNGSYGIGAAGSAADGTNVCISQVTRASGDVGSTNTSQQWKLVRAAYSVKFNANGGSGTMSNQSINIDVSTALTANAFTRSGYAFKNWNTAAKGTGTAYANKKSVSNLSLTHGATVNLYAQWTPYTLTLRYHANGGTLTTNTSATTRYRLSSSIVQRSTDSGSTWANASNAITTETTTANLFNVGTFGLSKTGYHIDGTKAWNTAADGTGVNVNQDHSDTSTANAPTVSRINGSALTANKTTTLYANWIPNTWYVAYNANGGSGSMEKSTHTYNIAKALSANTLTRNGYLFEGWNTKADGTGTAYTDKTSVKNLTASNGGTVTLYAQWEPLTQLPATGGSGTRIATLVAFCLILFCMATMMQRYSGSNVTA